jgi:OmpA-OmpF porin, OOP family
MRIKQRMSGSRTRSVVMWLTQHQVPADRLTAHGFGKTQPIASNDSDEGPRAEPRVEIANPGCAGQG